MDIPSLDPAKFQPMQLRFAVAGSAGAPFDALLGESRSRIETDDPGSEGSAETGRREDAPERNERNEPSEPDREPRWDMDDEGLAADPDGRGEQRAPDAGAEQAGDRLQPAAQSDNVAEFAAATQSPLTSQAKAANATAGKEHITTTGVASRGTPAIPQGQSGGPAPPQHGPIPQGAQVAEPPGPQSTRPPLHLVTSTTPPIAPPQGVLGAQAVLAAQNVAAGATASQPTGAEDSDPGNTAVQFRAAATVNAEAANSAEAASGEAARKIAVGSKNHTAQQGAAPVKTAHASGAAPATSPTSASANAQAASGPAFAGYAGAQPLGQMSLASPSLGLSTSPSADYAAPPPRPAAGQPLPVDQVAVQIHKAANAGQNKINLRLYPADLGRVEVRLEWADDGALRAVISAERSETLDLLQRDSRSLERALQDSGLKTDSGSLSFDLRGDAETRDDTGQSQAKAAEQSGQKQSNDDSTEDNADTSLSKRDHDGILDLSV